MGQKRKYRTISIIPCLNGFMCSIGCQTAVYRYANEMLIDLAAYYNDPEGTSEKFLENTLVYVDTMAPAPATAAVEGLC